MGGILYKDKRNDILSFLINLNVISVVYTSLLLSLFKMPPIQASHHKSASHITIQTSVYVSNACNCI